MLLPYLPILNQKKIILGSKSKGRNYLMTTQVTILIIDRKSTMRRFPAPLLKTLINNPFPHPPITIWQPAREKPMILPLPSRNNKNSGIY